MSSYMSRAELEEISEGLITAYANKFSNRVSQSIDIEHFITEFLMLRIEYAAFAEDDACLLYTSVQVVWTVQTGLSQMENGKTALMNQRREILSSSIGKATVQQTTLVSVSYTHLDGVRKIFQVVYVHSTCTDTAFHVCRRTDTECRQEFYQELLCSSA